MISSNPVFGFVLFGGTINGALIRDIRLANELHRRGYPVHVWWIVDRPRAGLLEPGIPQHWLCHSFRYATGRVSGILDAVGKLTSVFMSDRLRSQLGQRISWFSEGTLRGLIQIVCRGVQSDARLIRRFASELTEAGVTHATGTIEILVPFLQAAQQLVGHRLRFMVQFQGYETYTPHAARMGLKQQMFQRIREAVTSSDWPAVACSAAYADRVHRDIGVSFSDLQPIVPGVPIEAPLDLQSAIQQVSDRFPQFDPAIPLVSFLGRRDSEKGIDLLLYAIKILRSRRIPIQLAVCGPTAFGSRYGVACRQIAENLEIPVITSDYLSNELRTALFRASHCIVYPSIHEEPFGMVPVEAMVQGTPIVVADTGGVAQLPFSGSAQAGLVFRSWDSGDLANQLERLLNDQALHQRFCASAPAIAANYSVERFTDRILSHMRLPPWPHQTQFGQFDLPQRRAA